MKKSEAIFGVLRVPLDAFAVGLALLVAYRLRQYNVNVLPWSDLADATRHLPALAWYINTFLLPSVAVILSLSAMLGLYTLRSNRSAWIETGRIIVVTGLWVVIVMTWYLLVLRELFFSRALLLYGAVLIMVLMAVIRATLTVIQRAMLRQGIGKRMVVSVGMQGLSEAALRTLQDDERYQYLGHLPDLDSFKRILQKRSVDLIIQTDPNPQGEATVALINYCRSHHIEYAFLPPVFADVPHQLRVERLGPLPLIRFQPTPLDGWGRVIKRLFDIVVSFAALVLLSPLLLIIAVAVLIDSGWPVFYVSTRVGDQARRRIPILKFRSMIKGADAQKKALDALNHRTDGPLFKVKNDPRVTRVGRFLRRWTLDELPQLFNVLIGQLSLVGPRPHLPEEVERYSLEQRRVFAVKPGITGLAQVSGRSDLPFEDEVRYDLQYVEEWSIVLDLWVLWRTPFTIFSRKGAD